MSRLIVADAGPVRTMTFNRPEMHNSFDRAMVDEIIDVVTATGSDPAVRVLVLKGEGRSFSSGADLNEMLGQDGRSVQVITRRWIRMFDALEAMPQPVIASVHGHAIAGGTELSLACDFVVAGESSRFGLTESRVGVIPGAGASVRLSRWVGRAAAKEILMVGDPIPAREAFRMGLISRLVPDAEVDLETEALARTLAARSPLALAAAKRSVNIGAELELPEGIEYALQQFSALFDADDQKEGMSAFLEKRTPDFRGFAAEPASPQTGQEGTS
jgi:enoyl-CoA hydratase/carnithine racemase